MASRLRLPTLTWHRTLFVAAVLLALGGAVLTSSGIRDQPGDVSNLGAVGCSVSVSDAAGALRALSQAEPGETICFGGTALANTDLVLTRSGRTAGLITLLGGSTLVRSVHVVADNVVVDGFRTGHGGLRLSGTNITARRNIARDALDDGIRCEPCVDSVIDANAVVHADGSGILASGQRITVSGNFVTGSVRIGDTGDADGIRFFGSGLRITGNTITSISNQGYGPHPPHPDCFQTFDNGGKPPTTDVVISGNDCTGVAAQCLIATAEEAGGSHTVGRSHTIDFVGNRCSVGADQAVLVEWFPGVRVRESVITGPTLRSGAHFADGSTGGEVSGDTILGATHPYTVDASSQEGFHASGNVSG